AQSLPCRDRHGADARLGAGTDLLRLLLLRRELLVLPARAAGRGAPGPESHGSLPLVGDTRGHGARGSQAGGAWKDGGVPHIERERDPPPARADECRGALPGEPARARASPAVRSGAGRPASFVASAGTGGQPRLPELSAR